MTVVYTLEEEKKAAIKLGVDLSNLLTKKTHYFCLTLLCDPEREDDKVAFGYVGNCTFEVLLGLVELSLENLIKENKEEAKKQIAAMIDRVQTSLRSGDSSLPNLD